MPLPRVDFPDDLSGELRRTRDPSLASWVANEQSRWDKELLTEVLTSDTSLACVLAANVHVKGELLDHLLTLACGHVDQGRISTSALTMLVEVIVRRGDHLPSLSRLELLEELAWHWQSPKSSEYPGFHAYIEVMRESHERISEREGREALMRRYRLKQGIGEEERATTLPDTAGHLLLHHPLFPAERLPEIFRELNSRDLANEVAEVMTRGRTDLLDNPEVRRFMRAHLDSERVLAALLATPSPEDYVDCLRRLLSSKDARSIEQTLLWTLSRSDVPVTLPADLATELLAHPNAEIRLRVIRATGQQSLKGKEGKEALAGVGREEPSEEKSVGGRRQ